MSVLPWIFQRLADVDGSSKEAIKREFFLCTADPQSFQTSTHGRKGLLPSVFQHHGQRTGSPPRGHLLLRLPVARSRRGLLTGDALVGFPAEKPTGERSGERVKIWNTTVSSIVRKSKTHKNDITAQLLIPCSVFPYDDYVSSISFIKPHVFYFSGFFFFPPVQIDALQEVLEKLRSKEMPLEKKLGWLPSVSKKKQTENKNKLA